MEELAMVTLGMGLVSLGLIAGLVAQPTQIRTRCAPIATIVFSEIIAMRESRPSRIWVFLGHFQNYWHPVAQIVCPPKLNFFLAAHTPCPT